MKFENRQTEFPGKKKLIKVDENNTPIAGEIPVLVNVVKDEGTVYTEGTPVSADNLNKGNWRDDDSLSFKARENNTLPSARPAETQVITKANGRTWIIPPAGLGEAMEIADSIGTSVKVGGNVQKNIEFETDPQVQITTVNNKTDAIENLVDASLEILNDALDEKIDRMNTITQRAQVYTKDPNGTQRMLDYGSSVIPSGIVARDGEHIKVPNTPESPNDSSSKSYVDAQRDTRVARVTSRDIVYGTDGNGNPLNRTVNTSAANAGTIVERIADGQITVPASPSAATDATSKQYVDQHSGLFTGVGVSTSVAGANPLLTGITAANIAEGARIRVRFPNGVSNRTGATNLTVNGTPSAIWVNGAAISSTNPFTIPAGQSRVFTRLGSAWNMLTDGVPLWTDVQGNVVPGNGPRMIFDRSFTSGSGWIDLTTTESSTLLNAGLCIVSVIYPDNANNGAEFRSGSGIVDFGALSSAQAGANTHVAVSTNNPTSLGTWNRLLIRKSTNTVLSFNYGYTGAGQNTWINFTINNTTFPLRVRIYRLI